MSQVCDKRISSLHLVNVVDEEGMVAQPLLDFGKDQRVHVRRVLRTQKSGLAAFT
jgi:hypothetical protein